MKENLTNIPEIVFLPHKIQKQVLNWKPPYFYTTGLTKGPVFTFLTPTQLTFWIFVDPVCPTQFLIKKFKELGRKLLAACSQGQLIFRYLNSCRFCSFPRFFPHYRSNRWLQKPAPPVPSLSKYSNQCWEEQMVHSGWQCALSIIFLFCNLPQLPKYTWLQRSYHLSPITSECSNQG